MIVGVVELMGIIRDMDRIPGLARFMNTKELYVDIIP